MIFVSFPDIHFLAFQSFFTRRCFQVYTTERKDCHARAFPCYFNSPNLFILDRQPLRLFFPADTCQAVRLV